MDLARAGLHFLRAGRGVSPRNESSSSSPEQCSALSDLTPDDESTWQSAFIALVFAVHPLHVESVAWITERKDVLSGLFWMLTIGAYTEYRFTLKTGWYWFAVAAFALGLLAKPMLITLPFVLVLLDISPFARLTLFAPVPPNKANKNQVKLLASLREKIPFLFLRAPLPS